MSPGLVCFSELMFSNPLCVALRITPFFSQNFSYRRMTINGIAAPAIHLSTFGEMNETQGGYRWLNLNHFSATH
jgi:hypothetical protein